MRSRSLIYGVLLAVPGTWISRISTREPYQFLNTPELSCAPALVLSLKMEQFLNYAYIQGCHSPNVPKALSPSAAEAIGFQGLVVHSRDFAQNLDNILAKTNSESEPKYIVIVGGGKSAKE